MIKVAHIATTKNGGAGIAACRIHESLMQDERIESHLIQRYPLNLHDSINNIHRCTHFHPFSYRVKKRLGLLQYFSKIERYERIFEKEPKGYEFISLPFSYFPLHEHPIVREADVIHLHWTSCFLDMPSFFGVIKQPVVWTLHDLSPLLGIYHYKGDMERNRSLILQQVDHRIHEIKIKSLRQKDNIYIVPTSNWSYQSSINSESLGRYPHHLIPCGFNIKEEKQIDRNYSRNFLNIENGRKNILFVAENINNHRKGIDLLIDSLHRVNPTSYNLLSVGKGSIRDHLSSDINYIEFGSIANSDLLDFVFSAADVTIIPSREDTFNQVMIESMLNGTPIISFNNGGMADHIRTGENGILVTELTSKALADAINDFIDNKYQFDNNSIREYPMNNLSYEKQAEAYISLYKSILNK